MEVRVGSGTGEDNGTYADSIPTLFTPPISRPPPPSIGINTRAGILSPQQRCTMDLSA